MSVIGWLVVGVLAGLIAGRIGGESGEDFVFGMISGVAGAVLGGGLFSLAGQVPVTRLTPCSILVAAIGASLLMLLRQNSR